MTAKSTEQTAIGRQVLPIYDPSANVLLLIESANRRQDDLRAAGEKLSEAEIKRFNAELGCIKEVAKLRARHDKQLRKSEAKRLDSIRQVDISAVNTAAQEVRTSITALAKTTSDTAEVLRSTVASTADRLAKQNSETMEGFNKRVAALELSAAQGMGKQAIADPAQERITKMVEALTLGVEKRSGKGEGINATWVILLGAVSLIGGLLGIAGVLYAVLKP